MAEFNSRCLRYCVNCANQLLEAHSFCINCGTPVPFTKLEGNYGDSEELIKMYINCGYTYDVILAFLNKYHGICISMSTLQRRLKSYGLSRSNMSVHQDVVKALIRKELDGAGCLGGYRSVWHSLRLKHGVSISRHKVATFMREIDPDGVEERKRRRLRRREYSSLGPNFVWHVDGYDKLKEFGFPIHGCIDGYSRKILWLELSRTNNNPAVIAAFYIDCLRELGGCPVILSTDPGSENCTMAAMQVRLRSECTDAYASEKSHRFVESRRNQRIEAWWSFFRKSRSSWWINYFKDLSNRGDFLPGNEVHKECLWFCFSNLLREDLKFVRIHWNTHYIRRSRFETLPGQPDALFFLPERHEHSDQLIEVPFDDIEALEEHCIRISEDDDDNEYQKYFKHVVDAEGLPYPLSWQDAQELYLKLIALSAQ